MAKKRRTKKLKQKGAINRKPLIIGAVIALALVGAVAVNTQLRKLPGNPEVSIATQYNEPAQPHQVIVPDHFNGTLVLYFHGANGTDTTDINDAYTGPTFKALHDNGYLVATSLAHGNNWGNDVSQQDYIDLYNWVNQQYKPKNVVFMARSMGGLDSLNLLHKKAIPVKAYVGFAPVANLGDLYQTNLFSDQILAAYGADPSTITQKSAGHSPVSFNDYPDVPALIYSSYEDKVVKRANNTDMVQLKNKTVVTSHGDHGDPTSYNHPEEVIVFLNQHTESK